MVALPEVEHQPGPLGGLEAERLDVGEGRAAVDLRLALAEQVEVRAVEHQHRGFVHGGSMPARSGAAGGIPAASRDGPGRAGRAPPRHQVPRGPRGERMAVSAGCRRRRARTRTPYRVSASTTPPRSRARAAGRVHRGGLGRGPPSAPNEQPGGAVPGAEHRSARRGRCSPSAPARGRRSLVGTGSSQVPGQASSFRSASSIPPEEPSPRTHAAASPAAGPMTGVASADRVRR